jgi:hypothetical protein
MRQKQILRIVFLRLSIAFSTFAIGVCTYALWPCDRSTKIDKPEVGIGQTTPIVGPGSKPNPTVSTRQSDRLTSRISPILKSERTALSRLKTGMNQTQWDPEVLSILFTAM